MRAHHHIVASILNTFSSGRSTPVCRVPVRCLPNVVPKPSYGTADGGGLDAAVAGEGVFARVRSGADARGGVGHAWLANALIVEVTRVAERDRLVRDPCRLEHEARREDREALFADVAVRHHAIEAQRRREPRQRVDGDVGAELRFRHAVAVRNVRVQRMQRRRPSSALSWCRALRSSRKPPRRRA